MMGINNSNLPTNQTFKFEDYPGAQQWFAQFLQGLNLFTGAIYNMVNGNIGYQNLVVPQTFTKTITTPASGSVTFSFKNPLSITPTAVVLGNVYQSPIPSTHPSSATQAYWHFSQGTIYIDNIPNLSASTTYVVALVVF